MAKHKYIKEPELIWEYFQAYRKNVKDNPRMKVEYVGKDGERVNTPIERPLIIEGFFSYCREHYSVEMRHYWFNTEGAYDDYCTIITRVKEEIRAEQIDGGLTGGYNSNLTARVTGLVDKKENEIKGGLNIPPLPDIGKRN